MSVAERERFTAIAARMLADGPRSGKWSRRERDTAAQALGAVLAKTPARSEHGRLLSAALKGIASAEPLGEQEHAVMRCARQGITPVPASVAQAAAHYAGVRSRTGAVTEALFADGERAGAEVARVVAVTGAGPTWGELATAMGWPWKSRGAIIRALARDGWLVTGCEPRSLRPGVPS